MNCYCNGEDLEKGGTRGKVDIIYFSFSLSTRITDFISEVF